MSGNVRPIVTDEHRALAESLARAVDRPGQDVDRIARKLAEDEARDLPASPALAQSMAFAYWRDTARHFPATLPGDDIALHTVYGNAHNYAKFRDRSCVQWNRVTGERVYLALEPVSECGMPVRS